jgi:glucosamine-6-phosphate deaminase
VETIITADRSEMGRLAAERATRILVDAIRQRGLARLIVATGSSQFEVLESLVASDQIDWTKVDGFHLDEYIGIDAQHPASFCRYLKERFVDRVPLRSFHFLDGTKDPVTVCKLAGQAVSKEPIDVAMIGIGENGHLAFNDPPANFVTTEPYIQVELDEPCRMQQVGEGWFKNLAEVPTHAISMSIQQILKSKNIICSVPDERKADAVYRAVKEPVAPALPATILRTHSSTTLLLDRASAKLLDKSGA